MRVFDFAASAQTHQLKLSAKELPFQYNLSSACNFLCRRNQTPASAFPVQLVPRLLLIAFDFAGAGRWLTNLRRPCTPHHNCPLAIRGRRLWNIMKQYPPDSESKIQRLRIKWTSVTKASCSRTTCTLFQYGWFRDCAGLLLRSTSASSCIIESDRSRFFMSDFCQFQKQPCQVRTCSARSSFQGTLRTSPRKRAASAG